MYTRPYTFFAFFKHKNRDNGDCSLTKIVEIYTTPYTETPKS